MASSRCSRSAASCSTAGRSCSIDEPSKGLAPKLIGELVDALQRIATEATILLVEQNLAVVNRLAERVVVLDHGVVVHTGEVGDLEDPELARRLLGVAGAP